MVGEKHSSGGLCPGFTPLGIWAFSIGTSIGWGAFIVTCNAYLQKAGVFGTAFVSSGVAVYDPQTDSSFNDLVHRADQLMYDNKRKRKKLRDMPA